MTGNTQPRQGQVVLGAVAVLVVALVAGGALAVAHIFGCLRRRGILGRPPSAEDADRNQGTATQQSSTHGSKRSSKRLARERLATAIETKCRTEPSACLEKSQGEESECSICLQGLWAVNEDDADDIESRGANCVKVELSKLPCGHLFHEECLVDGWVKVGRGRLCPLCKYDLSDLVDWKGDGEKSLAAVEAQ